MKSKKIFGAAAAVLAVSLAASGCMDGGGASSASRSDSMTSNLLTLPTSHVSTDTPEHGDNPASTDTPEHGDDSETAIQRDFGSSGSILSLVNGTLDIARRTRDTERSMGGDDWTILVYMCGTDLESNGGSASADLYEAMQADIGDNINFVFQTGGTYSWYYDDIDPTKLQRFAVDGDSFELIDERPLSSMGEADTLSDFIKWGVKKYPADNIGLVFWNHGGGSISGVCFDEIYDNDSLSLSEIDKALSDTFDCMTEKFEFIGFDACLMSTLETANILVPYANYMYASEETEPGYGWDYAAVMSYLDKNPRADGAQLGSALCDAYYDYCKLNCSEDTATFAITDLSRLDALIASFDATARQMYESDKLTELVKAIQSADNFGGNNRTEGYTNMVDLGGILSAAADYCPNAQDTLQKLDSAISCMRNGQRHRYASGLAIYYPLSVQGSTELSTFGTICPSAYYLAFVDKAAYGTTGKDIYAYENGGLINDCDNIWDIDYNYGDYCTNTDSFTGISEDCTIPIKDIYFDNDGYYTVAIPDFTNLSYAACSLFLEQYGGMLIYLGCDDDIYYDYSKGIITDNFDGSWISLPDSQPLPIEVVYQNDDYSLYTCSILLNGEHTNLRIEYDWNHSDWKVIGAWDGIDSDTGMAARDIIKLKNGDVIQPVYSYTENDTTDYFVGAEYTIYGDLKLTYQMLPEGDYTYGITLYDIYGNWFFTPDITFTVESDGSLTIYPDELDSDYSNDSGTEWEYQYIDCPYCYGKGCDWCGYYGYLLEYPCEECGGNGCDLCYGYGTLLAIACDYCHGEGCDYCAQYY